jgi:uncharacterized caspase-like protein
MQKLIIYFLFLHCLVVHSQQKGVSPVSVHASFNNSNERVTTYAVVVGISDYQDSGIPDLKYAHKDAQAFAQWLASPAGGNLDKDHLKVLINSEATLAQLVNALDWLIEVTKEGNQAILYFSGHGDVEKKTITQPGYLLCWDAPARVYMAGGAINVRDLKEVISTLSLQNKAKVTLITDACRAGKLSGSIVDGAQATAANLSQQFANEVKILSCQPNEYSLEGEQWGNGRGVFSYHLIDGLYGLADKNNDKSIDLMEISRYLEDLVTVEAQPQRQIPMVIGNRSEKLGIVEPKLLAQLKEEKKNQMQVFSYIESRVAEEQILST